MNDHQAMQTAFANFLMEKIRQDKHPSVTQMDLLESMIPPSLTRKYFEVLLEKVAVDSWPSNSQLARLHRLTQL